MKNIQHITQSVTGAIIRNIRSNIPFETVFATILKSANNLSTIAAVFKITKTGGVNDSWAIINTNGPLVESNFDTSLIAKIATSIRVDSQDRFELLTKPSQIYVNNPYEVATEVRELLIDDTLNSYHQNTQKASKSRFTISTIASLHPAASINHNIPTSTVMKQQPTLILPNNRSATTTPDISISTITTTSSNSAFESSMEQRLNEVAKNMTNMFQLMQSQLTQLQSQCQQQQHNVVGQLSLNPRATSTQNIRPRLTQSFAPKPILDDPGPNQFYADAAGNV
jgi:hypothetical protein